MKTGVTQLARTVAAATCCWFALGALSFAAPGNAQQQQQQQPQQPQPQSHSQQAKPEGKSSSANKSSSTKKYPHQNRIHNQEKRLNRAYDKGKISKSQYEHDKSNLASVKHTEKSETKNGAKMTNQQQAEAKSELSHSGNKIHNQKQKGSNPPH